MAWKDRKRFGSEDERRQGKKNKGIPLLAYKPR
jgi:hypothetical protein